MLLALLLVRPNPLHSTSFYYDQTHTIRPCVDVAHRSERAKQTLHGCAACKEMEILHLSLVGLAYYVLDGHLHIEDKGYEVPLVYLAGAGQLPTCVGSVEA